MAWRVATPGDAVLICNDMSFTAREVSNNIEKCLGFARKNTFDVTDEDIEVLRKLMRDFLEEVDRKWKCSPGSAGPSR